MSIATQSAVGALGNKATTELSWAFTAMVNCGAYQYGLNDQGIYLLNTGTLDGTASIGRSITFVTSDYGSPNHKRLRFIYLQVEVAGNASFTVAVKPNSGSWLSKTASTTGEGLKTLKVSIDREGGQGNYLTIKITSNDWFKLHAVNGIMIVRSLM